MSNYDALKTLSAKGFSNLIFMLVKEFDTPESLTQRLNEEAPMNVQKELLRK